jgi:glyoxylase-like metal-dependent hydrolase (beta-lactamase superfamily II)
MFGVVPKVLWSRQVPADELNRIELGLRCLLVRGPGFNCLIETGMGDKWDPRAAAQFELRTRALDDVLLAETGLAASDITHVIVTHLHFDHAGGLTRLDEGGHARPVFPNAEVLVSALNLRNAESPHPRERASYRAENWRALADRGQLRPVAFASGPHELLPGVSAELSHGHTRGQWVLHLDGGGKHSVFAADLVPTSAHLGRNWGMGFDVEPLVVAEEKTRLLERAAREGWTFVFGHDAERPTARVEAWANKQGETDFRAF